MKEQEELEGINGLLGSGIKKFIDYGIHLCSKNGLPIDEF